MSQVRGGQTSASQVPLIAYMLYMACLHMSTTARSYYKHSESISHPIARYLHQHASQGITKYYYTYQSKYSHKQIQDTKGIIHNSMSISTKIPHTNIPYITKAVSFLCLPLILPLFRPHCALIAVKTSLPVNKVCFTYLWLLL